MPDESGFRLDWEAGASAQVELFSPGTTGAGRVYQLKYTPPFRSTIRPPLEQRPLGPGELSPLNQALDRLVSAVNASTGRYPARAAAAEPAGTSVLDQVNLVGNQLLDLVIPRDIQADMRTSGLFLEIGLDEALLEYPWEIMHDGDNFLCLKHFMGRFVNATEATPLGMRLTNWLGSSVDALSVLLISVPNPQPRGNLTYERLPEAEAETTAIVDTLSGEPGVTVNLLAGREATYNAVYQALKRREYHIVHFNGHAQFNDQDPGLSGLVLYDQDMTTGPVVSFFGSRPPILCFMNACETARPGVWKSRYDIFGLARAFLETGSYLLGSRWKLSDKAAAVFARKFYSSLVKEQKSLGCAIMDARLACKADLPVEDIAWASYIFYGDPRVCFRRL